MNHPLPRWHKRGAQHGAGIAKVDILNTNSPNLERVVGEEGETAACRPVTVAGLARVAMGCILLAAGLFDLYARPAHAGEPGGPA